MTNESFVDRPDALPSIFYSEQRTRDKVYFGTSRAQCLTFIYAEQCTCMQYFRHILMPYVEQFAEPKVL